MVKGRGSLIETSLPNQGHLVNRNPILHLFYPHLRTRVHGFLTTWKMKGNSGGKSWTCAGTLMTWTLTDAWSDLGPEDKCTCLNGETSVF